MLNVKLISMNYENVYGYLCFCCADAVDCGAASPRCMIFTLTPVSGTGTGFVPLSSRERGIGWVFWTCCCPALHLWIADQVRNDGPEEVGVVLFTIAPVSGTGTGFGPLPSRERGFCWLVWLVAPRHAPRCGFPPTRE